MQLFQSEQEKNTYKKLFGSDAQRVKYLRERAKSNLMSSAEAQELLNLAKRHDYQISKKFYFALVKLTKEKVSKNVFQTESFLERKNIEFAEFQQELDSKKDKREASRDKILESIKAFRLKHFGKNYG